MVDPEEVRSHARALVLRASAVGDLGDGIRRSLEAATWEGPAAARLAQATDAVSWRIRRHGEDLGGLAIAVARLAEHLAQELADLKLIEDQVRAWYPANPGVAEPWPQASLPAPGDPEWRRVHEAFAAAGVPLDSHADAPLPPAVTDAATPPADAGDWKSTLSPAEAWIIQHESNFDPTAVNPSSGAFGIWQGLGATLETYADRFGFDTHTTDPNQQLQMFRAYIKDRYGTAEQAKAFWEEHHWY